MIAQMAHPPSCAVALGAPEAPQVPTRYTEPHLFSGRCWKQREYQEDRSLPVSIAANSGELVPCSNASMASSPSLDFRKLQTSPRFRRIAQPGPWMKRNLGNFGSSAQADRVFFISVLIGLIGCTLLSCGAAVLLATQSLDDITINGAEAPNPAGDNGAR